MVDYAQYIDNNQLKELQDSNISKRIQLLEELNNSKFAKLCKEKCSNDIHFWLNNFCCTYDPRKEANPNDIPFIAYDFQRETIDKIIDHIENGKDLLIEKSRDMGISWIILYVFQWYWQFKKGSNFHIGSKKQDNVDIIGDISSLFGKLRYNIRKQPKSLLPDEFDLSKCSSFCKIINSENGNAITGESSNPNFARSGRYTGVLFDEFAFWESAAQSWVSSGESSPCRIAASTPYGKNNKFAELRFKSNIEVISLHWTLHPRKTNQIRKQPDGKYTSSWYEYQKTRYNRVELAREVDIDYQTSREGAIYKFDNTKLVEKGLLQRVISDPGQNKNIVRIWDFGLNPAILWTRINNQGIEVLTELTPVDRPTLDMLIPRVTQFTNQHFRDFTISDLCDIAGNQTNRQTGKTDIDILNANGIYPDYDKVPIEDGIICVQSLIDRVNGFVIDSNCTETIDALMGGYYRKEDKSGLGKEMPPEQVHPYEDVMDCLRYVVWKHFRPNHQTKIIDESKYIEEALAYEEIY